MCLVRRNNFFRSLRIINDVTRPPITEWSHLKFLWSNIFVAVSILTRGIDVRIPTKSCHGWNATLCDRIDFRIDFVQSKNRPRPINIKNIDVSKISTCLLFKCLYFRESFLPARSYVSAVFAVERCPSVPLSVCPTHAGIVSKQLNLS